MADLKTLTVAVSSAAAAVAVHEAHRRPLLLLLPPPPSFEQMQLRSAASAADLVVAGMPAPAAVLGRAARQVMLELQLSVASPAPSIQWYKFRTYDMPQARTSEFNAENSVLGIHNSLAHLNVGVHCMATSALQMQQLLEESRGT